MAAIAGALLKMDEANSGIDWTQVIIAGFLFAGVIVTSVFGFLGVRFAKGAKAEAAITRTENSSDHGRVREALDGLRFEVVHLRGDIGAVGQNVGALRDQFVEHLQHHIDKGCDIDFTESHSTFGRLSTH